MSLDVGTPTRVLVEMIDADGCMVLIPVLTGAVVTRGPLEAGPVGLDDGYIEVGDVVLERDGRREALPGGAQGRHWARLQQEREPLVPAEAPPFSPELVADRSPHEEES